jgi:hypothetical protein
MLSGMFTQKPLDFAAFPAVILEDYLNIPGSGMIITLPVGLILAIYIGRNLNGWRIASIVGPKVKVRACNKEQAVWRAAWHRAHQTV